MKPYPGHLRAQLHMGRDDEILLRLLTGDIEFIDLTKEQAERLFRGLPHIAVNNPASHEQKQYSIRIQIDYPIDPPQLAWLSRRLLNRMRYRTDYTSMGALQRFIFQRDGGCCRYCGVALIPGSDMHLDHILPRSQGGEDEIDNLALACSRCNLSKGGRTPEEARMRLRSPVPLPEDRYSLLVKDLFGA